MATLYARCAGERPEPQDVLDRQVRLSEVLRHALCSNLREVRERSLSIGLGEHGAQMRTGHVNLQGEVTERPPPPGTAAQQVSSRLNIRTDQGKSSRGRFDETHMRPPGKCLLC